MYGNHSNHASSACFTGQVCDIWPALSRSSTTTFPCQVVWRTELARLSQERSSFYKPKQKRRLDSLLPLFSFAFCSLHRYALFTLNRGKETYRSSGATLFSRSSTATDPFFFTKKKKTNATRRHRVTSLSATPRYRATQLSRSATDHISFLNVTVRHRVTLLLVRDRSYFLYSTPWHRATPLSWSAEDVFLFNAIAWSSDAAL